MTDTKAAVSFREFCAQHGFSTAKGYLLLAQGKGPRIMKIGTRTLVTNEAAAEWRRRMEAETAQPAA